MEEGLEGETKNLSPCKQLGLIFLFLRETPEDWMSKKAKECDYTIEIYDTWRE